MSQPIDYDNLNLLKSVIGSDLKPILLSFLEITPAVVEKLGLAISNQDAKQVQHQAHTLKGSAANVGALTLPEICLKLEDMGRKGDITQAPDAFSQLQTAYPELAQAIQNYINQHL